MVRRTLFGVLVALFAIALAAAPATASGPSGHVPEEGCAGVANAPVEVQVLLGCDRGGLESPEPE